MKKIAVFASGTGSNFQAMIDAIEAGELSARIVLLVCDQANAQSIARAAHHGIETYCFDPRKFSSKAMYEQEILTRLQDESIDLVVLAGYMRLIGKTLLDVYMGKIVNIHPSLLPSFPGKNAIGQALAAGVKVTGVTVHYVDEGMDTGTIISQEAVPVDVDDTHLSLQAKIQVVEHRLYVETIRNILQLIENVHQ